MGEEESSTPYKDYANKLSVDAYTAYVAEPYSILGLLGNAVLLHPDAWDLVDYCDATITSHPTEVNVFVKQSKMPFRSVKRMIRGVSPYNPFLPIKIPRMLLEKRRHYHVRMKKLSINDKELTSLEKLDAEVYAYFDREKETIYCTALPKWIPMRTISRLPIIHYLASISYNLGELSSIPQKSLIKHLHMHYLMFLAFSMYHYCPLVRLTMSDVFTSNEQYRLSLNYYTVNIMRYLNMSMSGLYYYELWPMLQERTFEELLRSQQLG